MALGSRGQQRFSAIVWPGFVDVMTALVLVLFFVLSIFMIVQFVLRDTITGQGRQLDALSVQVANLADALGLERSRADREAALVSTLTGERDAAAARAADFEARVAGLIARTAAAEDTARAAADARAGLEAALAQARSELDASTEAARLAAARREALEALAATLRTEAEGSKSALTDAETARLTEAAAAAELRRRLENADAELTAMTLSLEAERRKAEETLTLLAAAEAARDRLQGDRRLELTDAERRAAELAQARALLSEEKATSAAAQRQVALLNQQTAELRAQLDSLQGMIDAAAAKDVAAQVQIEKLGANLNAALARVAAEEKARADREARARAALQGENLDLAGYRSEFFGRMREILGSREGVQVVGDRFVFPSEVLFAPGSATLGAAGQEQVARVAAVIREVSAEIPPEVDWVLRVDGHTDKTPVTRGGWRDNWELSLARALSVVRYMSAVEGIPADRLAATGFGEFRPLDPGDSPEALARNRRIELKFTER